MEACQWFVSAFLYLCPPWPRPAQLCAAGRQGLSTCVNSTEEEEEACTHSQWKSNLGPVLRGIN